jgi:hypothetical protein
MDPFPRFSHIKIAVCTCIGIARSRAPAQAHRTAPAPPSLSDRMCLLSRRRRLLAGCCCWRLFFVPTRNESRLNHRENVMNGITYDSRPYECAIVNNVSLWTPRSSSSCVVRCRSPLSAAGLHHNGWLARQRIRPHHAVLFLVRPSRCNLRPPPRRRCCACPLQLSRLSSVLCAVVCCFRPTMGRTDHAALATARRAAAAAPGARQRPTYLATPQAAAARTHDREERCRPSSTSPRGRAPRHR